MSYGIFEQTLHIATVHFLDKTDKMLEPQLVDELSGKVLILGSQLVPILQGHLVHALIHLVIH